MLIDLYKALFKWYFFLKQIRIRQLNKNRTVAFFNTHDKGGGAAKVCYQLFSHVNFSKMFVFYKRTNESNIREFDPILWNRIGQIAKKIEEKYGIIDFSKIGVINLIKDDFFNSSKIVHLHNTHGYYLSFLGLQNILKNKEVIWTLHDDYMLTGHCSFSMQCIKWIQGCKKCPDLSIYPSLINDTTAQNQKEKLKFLKKINPHIVTPSKWLENRVRLKYPFLNNIQTIYNGVDTSVFYPFEDKNNVRNKHGIYSNSFVILFIAELSTNNPFKGGDIIREILNMDLPNHWVLITVGDKNVESNNLNHFSFPYINSDSELNELYNLSDIMLYPTKADNLPLVVLESMSAGTPVISSEVGGINEIISDEIDGFLVSNIFSNEFYKKLIYFEKLSSFEKLKISKKSRSKIVEKFNQNSMIQAYKRIYEIKFENKMV